jgi:hypothetical protein
MIFLRCWKIILVQKKKKIKRNLKRSGQDIKISEEHGAEIKGLHYITRTEHIPSLYENADFSLPTIKNSIKD